MRRREKSKNEVGKCKTESEVRKMKEVNVKNMSEREKEKCDWGWGDKKAGEGDYEVKKKVNSCHEK